jgi:hypothetical protein
MGTLQSPAGRPIFYGHSGTDRVTLMCYDDGVMAIVRNGEEAGEFWPPEEVEACMRAFMAALDRPAKLGRRESGPRADFKCDTRPSPNVSIEDATKQKRPAVNGIVPAASCSKPGNLENLKKTLAAAPSAMRFSIIARIDLAQDGAESGSGNSARKGDFSHAAGDERGQFARLRAR